MFCIRCGAEFADHERFCTNCGSPHSPPPTQQAASAPPGPDRSPGATANSRFASVPFGSAGAVTSGSNSKILLLVGGLILVTVVGVVAVVLISGRQSDTPAVAEPGNSAVPVSKTSSPPAPADVAERAGSITGADVNLRGDASLRASSLLKLDRGDRVVILDERQGSSTERQLAVAVTLPRSGGSGSASLHKGIGVEVLSEGGGTANVRAVIQSGTFEGTIPSSSLSPIISWYRVRTEDGTDGWVSAAFVEVGGPTASGAAVSSSDQQWTEYWARFSKAVETRDRKALLGLMSKSFETNGGGESTSEEWLATMDSLNLWTETQRSVATGTKSCPAHFERPKSSCRITRDDYLIFDYSDGQWRWTGLMGD